MLGLEEWVLLLKEEGRRGNTLDTGSSKKTLKPESAIRLSRMQQIREHTSRTLNFIEHVHVPYLVCFSH